MQIGKLLVQRAASLVPLPALMPCCTRSRRTRHGAGCPRIPASPPRRPPHRNCPTATATCPMQAIIASEGLVLPAANPGLDRDALLDSLDKAIARSFVQCDPA